MITAVPGLRSASFTPLETQATTAAITVGTLAFGRHDSAESTFHYAAELVPFDNFAAYTALRRGETPRRALAEQAGVNEAVVRQAEYGTQIPFRDADRIHRATGGLALCIAFWESGKRANSQRLLLMESEGYEFTTGALIKEVRTRQGLSQERLAAEAKTSQSLIALIESPRRLDGTLYSVRQRALGRYFGAMHVQTAFCKIGDRI